jgi:hypothetical protein
MPYQKLWEEKNSAQAIFEGDSTSFPLIFRLLFKLKE